MNQSCLNILDAIVSCDYLIKNRDIIISIFYDTFHSRNCEIYVTMRYSKLTDKFEKILVVKLILAILFRGNKYDVSMLIYFPKMFPAEAPEFFIEKNEPIGVNNQCKIVDNRNLRIVTSEMSQWSLNNTNINNILDQILKEFSTTFPVYKLDKKTKSIDYGEDCILFKDNLQNVSFEASSQLDLENRNSPAYDKNAYDLKNHPFEIFNQSNNYLISYDDSKQNISNNISNPSTNSNSVFINNNKPNINQSNISESSGLMSEKKIKEIYIQTVVNKLKTKVLSEYNLKKEEGKILNNFKSSYNDEINEIKDFLSKKDSILNTIKERSSELIYKANEVNEALQKLNAFIDQGNFDYTQIITIDNNKETLELISKLAVLEEMTNIVKKAFEKKIFDLNESINYIRRLTKEIFILKYCIIRNLDKNI